jgi:hypothetical protein
VTESTKWFDVRWPAAALLALLVAVALAVEAPPASAARLTSAKAKSAVIKYVKRTWGSDYAVHPACYTLSSRKAKCFVHMVHASSTCTKYATVTLKSGRVRVSMAKPSC